MKKRVLLAMSGGIDSSAAAIILKNSGYDVEGFTFKIRGVTSEAVDRASKICKKLGIKHVYHDISEIFHKEVVEYFKSEYENGRTPNPCIMCNLKIKFGLIYEYAIDRGFDFAATGHYASILIEKGKYYLAESKDPTRDQTYFLYVLTEDKLKRILFPLNGIPKTEARKICSEAGILPADSKESREICFVPENYKEYLRNELNAKSKSGNFIDKYGIVMGNNRGIMNYTIGQRKGLGLNLGKPAYILDINNETGDITIGDEKKLFSSEISIKNVNLINGSIPNPGELYVRIRYGAKPALVERIDITGEVMTIRVKTPQRAVTPGQSAVLYNNNIVVGGGIIT